MFAIMPTLTWPHPRSAWADPAADILLGCAIHAGCPRALAGPFTDHPRLALLVAIWHYHQPAAPRWRGRTLFNKYIAIRPVDGRACLRQRVIDPAGFRDALLGQADDDGRPYHQHSPMLTTTAGPSLWTQVPDALG
jgi:hypothetical protein